MENILQCSFKQLGGEQSKSPNSVQHTTPKSPCYGAQNIKSSEKAAPLFQQNYIKECFKTLKMWTIQDND